MPLPKQASDRGLQPHWKVRIVFPGSIVHVASWTEPVMRGREVQAEWVADSAYGDTIGFIDWPTVIAVTWRRAD